MGRHLFCSFFTAMTLKGAVRLIVIALVYALVLEWNGLAKAAGSNDQICDTRADYYLGIENYPRAIRYHQALVAARPDDALAHYHLGFAYGMMGQREEEIAEYRKAAALGLSDWDLYLNLGRAYLERGDFNQASDVLHKATALGPTRPEAHFNLGLAYERLGMLEPAKQELQTSLKLDPAQPDALNMLGLIYAEERDYVHARQVWDQLSHDDPDYRPARVNLAILNVAAKRPGWRRSGDLAAPTADAREHGALSKTAWR